MCDPFPRRSLAEKTPPGPAPTKLDHWGLENGRHLRSSTRREERGSSNRWWPTSRWTNRCSRRCCKKRSEARPAARSGPAPARGLSRERPTGLRRGRMPARDVLLPRQASGSDPAADAAARVGGGAAAVRLSTALHPAPTVGVARESQADLPAVRRGATGGAEAPAEEAGQSPAGGAAPAHAAE